MRALVALLAVAVLTACAPEVTYPNQLRSCSAALPRDWRDALAAHELKENVQIVAASDDGRMTLVLASPPVNELTLRTDDGQRRSIVKTDDFIVAVELTGHTVKYATQQPGREPSFYLWDTQTNGPSVPTDGQLPFKAVDKSTDGTTSAWARQPHPGRLFVQRPGWPQPRLIAEIEVEDANNFVVHPSVHGDFVSWSPVRASYVTDIRTGATVYLGSMDYRLEVLNGALVRSGGGVVSAVPLSALSPLPTC